MTEKRKPKPSSKKSDETFRQAEATAKMSVVNLDGQDHPFELLVPLSDAAPLKF